MGITVKEGGGEFQQAPTGTHIGICFRIIDLGTQEPNNPNYNPARKIILEFELPGETLEIDGIKKPFTISSWYTASLSEKANLRRDLQGWRGKQFTPEELQGFDLKNILGKAAMLSVVASDKGKSYISSISALPKGMPVPEQFNVNTFFSLEDFSRGVFEELPKGIQKIIEKSPEYQSIAGTASSDDRFFGDLTDMKDDIPF